MPSPKSAAAYTKFAVLLKVVVEAKTATEIIVAVMPISSVPVRPVKAEIAASSARP